MKNSRLFRIGGAVVLLASVALAFFFTVHSHQASAVSPNYYYKYGPIQVTNDQDSGTCGNTWAIDSFNRVFTVNSRDSAVFYENFQAGHFTTVAGQSPEACASGVDNGNTVGDGIKGIFSGGYFHVAVTGGAFNNQATCGIAGSGTCDTTDEFVATVYGPNATYQVNSYDFDYSTKENGADTQDSADLGGYYGDITSPLGGASHTVRHHNL